MIKFFEKYPEIIAVMSEKKDGSMKLFKDGSANIENRNKFFKFIGIDSGQVISAGIANGINVKIISANSPKIIYEADGLVTNDKNTFLSITIADCIPVYFYEPKNGISGIAHCGWKGIVNGIIKNTLNKIFELGGKTENLAVALGPGICKSHFEIKEDISDKFSDYPEFIIRSDDKISVDLRGIIKKQLGNFQIKSENIEDNPDCTFEGDKYFSFRRDKPKIIEAMVAIIGTKLM